MCQKIGSCVYLSTHVIYAHQWDRANDAHKANRRTDTFRTAENTPNLRRSECEQNC